jgi:hypothetical protein
MLEKYSLEANNNLFWPLVTTFFFGDVLCGIVFEGSTAIASSH